MTEMWTEKYRPKTAEKTIMNQDLLTVINSFLKTAFIEIKRVNKLNKAIQRENKQIRLKNKSLPKSKQKKLKKEKLLDGKKVALLLEGAPGIGKTTTVLAVANSLKIPLIETNASDKRTIKNMRELLTPATKYLDISSFSEEEVSKKKIIFIDEVDGIHGSSERGGVQELMKIIKKTSFPIILAANEWKANLKTLYDGCRKYEVPKPSTEAILKLINSINLEEGLKMTKVALGSIANNSHGDFRAAINDLQMKVSANRDQLDGIFDIIRAYFTARKGEEVKHLFRVTTTETQKIFKWIFENITPRIVPGKTQKICQVLAKADLIIGRIHKLEDWSAYPNFIEIIKDATIFTKGTNDRITAAKFFRSTTNTVEEIMNEKYVSKEEADTLEALLKVMKKKKSRRIQR